MSKIFLSVVIPSYNETENLERGVLAQVRDYLKSQKYTWEVIVSDDDSPDSKSKALARDFCDKNKGFVYLQNVHGGKPMAVWSGIQKSQGDLVLFADMDQSTPISELGKILPYFDQKYDIVIGSRGIERKNFSLLRRLASMIFREIRRSLLLSEIIDTQAGFKCLRSQVAKEIFPLLEPIRQAGKEAHGWTVSSFDVELLVACEYRGYKIAEVPVSWEDRDKSKAKAVERQQGKYIKESLDMLKEIFRVKLNQMRGMYKK